MYRTLHDIMYTNGLLIYYRLREIHLKSHPKFIQTTLLFMAITLLGVDEVVYVYVMYILFDVSFFPFPVLHITMLRSLD